MSGNPIEPITFAVVKSALDSIVDEVAYTVLRTARSEIVKDVMDYSAAICDRDGNMIAQAKTIALHLGAVPEAMAVVMEKYRDSLRPGDAVILNDPYRGGMHLPDIFMFAPVFYRDVLEGFCVVICHHTDVGGRVAGSNASDSTEIFQEGLRLPALKLYEAGSIVQPVAEIIALNVRVPDRVMGDLYAQYAACQVGIRELNKLADKYTAPVLRSYYATLLDYAETMTRKEIRTWPSGDFYFEDFIDDDGLDPEPIKIAVTLSVHDGSVTIDYTGSSPQVRGAINATKSYTNSCSYLSVRCALKGDVPNNAGVFRCINVVAPVGSVLNPLPPAPVAARALTGYRICDVLFGALAQVVPDRIPAAGEGGNTVVCLSGWRPGGRPFIIVDMICGAWGGRPDRDGIEAITNPSQNLSNTPVEVLEAQHPVRVEEYSLRPDSCGAGLWRGGTGVCRSYKVLADDTLLQLRSDRVRFRPYGLQGGSPGKETRNVLVRNGVETELPSKSTMKLLAGDLIRHEQAGAGGFGDPEARDPELVRKDVWDGKITSAFALTHHRVVVDAAGRNVDWESTKAARSKSGRQAVA
jgi:N-methylhydantoinase B